MKDEDEIGTKTLRAAWRRSTPGLVSIGVFSVFINLSKLAVPLFVMQVLDRVISSRSIPTLIMLTSITLIAVTAGVLLEVVRRRMFLNWGGWVERHFGAAFFRAGAAGDESGRLGYPSKPLKDLATLRTFLGSSAPAAWLDVVWIPVFVALVALIHPALGAIAAAAIIVMLAIGVFNERSVSPLREEALKARSEDREWSAVAERDGETIGALSLTDNLAERWRRNAESRHRDGGRAQAQSISAIATMRWIGRILRVGGMAVGVWLMVQGVISFGMAIAAGVLSRLAYSAGQRAMRNWRRLADAREAYGRLETALSRLSVRRVSILANDLPLSITLENVGHRYPHAPKSVFRGVNLTLEPGEVIAVYGPSAEGKTTFARLMTGALAPRSGSIRLGDVDLSRLPPDELARVVGYLPQDAMLFRGTVRENIARMNAGDFSEVVQAARLAGVHDRLIALPQGYDTEIHDKTPLLSGGERKAVALARAFYGWPALIVLDEPEANFDKANRRALTAALKTLKAQGAIVIVTSQSIAISRGVDKVLQLKGGKVAIIDGAAEVRRWRIATRGAKGGRAAS